MVTQARRIISRCRRGSIWLACRRPVRKAALNDRKSDPRVRGLRFWRGPLALAPPPPAAAPLEPSPHHWWHHAEDRRDLLAALALRRKRYRTPTVSFHLTRQNRKIEDVRCFPRARTNAWSISLVVIVFDSGICRPSKTIFDRRIVLPNRLTNVAERFLC